MGFCPVGFCHVGFCPDTPSNTSSSLFCLVGNTDVEETTNRSLTPDVPLANPTVIRVVASQWHLSLRSSSFRMNSKYLGRLCKCPPIRVGH